MRGMPVRSLLGVAAVVLSLIGVVLAGLNTTEPPPGPPPEVALRMMAGSELDDLIDPGNPEAQEFLRRMTRDTGVSLKTEFTGSLTGAEKIADSDDAYDVAWFASDSYLQVLDEDRVRPGVPIMSSPVVLGLRPSVAAGYGWDSEPPSWSGIATEVARRNPETGRGLAFAMTDPAFSNSGLSALAAAATAFNGARPLDPGAVEAVGADLTRLFSGNGNVGGGVQQTADSSGWLTASYLRGLLEVDGLVNYESELLSLNQEQAVGVDRLELIYPSDGVTLADYPLMLLSTAASEKQAGYERLQKWLTGAWAQQWIVEHTRRRSIDPDLNRDFPALPAELSVPADKATLDDLILTYQDHARSRPSTFYVIDTSGSMNKQEVPGASRTRIEALRNVFRELTGNGEGSSVAQFREFRDREEVFILPFSTSLPEQVAPDGSLRERRDLLAVTIDGRAGTEVQDDLLARVNSMAPSDSTAIYDGLYEAYVRFAEESQRVSGGWETYTADRYPTIVLLTDGVNREGMNLQHFKELWRRLPSREVPVLAVSIGQGPVASQCTPPEKSATSDEPPLCQIARLTGGRVFDTNDTKLLDIMRLIRGNQ